METAVQFENELLNAASLSDVTYLMNIVTTLTPRQKALIDQQVFDKALDTITYHQDSDPATYSHMILTFFLAAGRYTSPVAVSAALQAMPRQAQSIF